MTQEEFSRREEERDERDLEGRDGEDMSLSERHALAGDHVQPPLTQCFRCARRFSGPFCEAFPDGIPEDVQLGAFDHTNPHHDDNGLRFVEGRSPHITYRD